MKNLLLATAAVCVFASALAAQGKFPLKYQVAEESLGAIVQMTTQAYGAAPAPPDVLKNVPKDLPSQTAYAQAVIGGQRVWMIIAAGDPPKLYLDASGKGDFSGAKAVEGKAEPGRLTFASVEVPQANGAAARVRVTAHAPDKDQPPQFVVVSAAGCLLGEVRLGDKAYRVAIVDGDTNGRYAPASAPALGPRGTDGLAIDLNGDGRFDPPSLEKDEWEWMPLAKGLCVGGTYWAMEVAADRASVEVKKVSPPMGAIEAKPGVDLRAFGDYGLSWIRPTGGKVQFPAGTYMPVVTMLTKNDDAGTPWMLRSSGGDQPFEVPADGTLALPIGPPLVTKVAVQQRERTVSVDLALVGQAGEQYAPGAMKGKERMPPPKLEIVDEAGKVLQTGQFEYG